MATPSVHKIPQQIETALKKAAETTGIDFQYLVDTAARESGFRASVKAKTSSASGLFQFIESTWLQMVKEKGGDYGLQKYAKHINKTDQGRYFVKDDKMRREILNLRNDAGTASLMAGAFTQMNAEALSERVGRRPTPGELYIAHFLGAGNGGKLIQAATANPTMRADKLFPSAARSNKPLFYKSGAAVSVKQLYQNLVRRHHVQSVAVAEAKQSEKLPIKPDVSQIAGAPEILQGSALKAILASAQTLKNESGLLNDQVGAGSEAASGSSIDERASGGLGVWQVYRAGDIRDQSPEKPRPLLAQLEAAAEQKLQKRPILEINEGVKGLFKKGGLG